MTCTDCGTADVTVLVETTLGDWFCRRCWADTTAGAERPMPATPRLDFWMKVADRLVEKETP